MVLISIVMPTLNSQKTISPALDAMLASLKGCSYEFIAVDGGSSDKTLKIIRDKIAKPTIAFEHKGSQALAVDLGVKAARAFYVCFLDSDVVVPPNFFNALILDITKNDAVAAEAALINVGSRQTLKGQTIATSASRACLLVRRSILDFEVDPRLKVAEDVNLTQQIMMRGKIIKDNDVVCYHIRDFKIWGDMKRCAKYWYYQGLNYYLLPESPYRRMLKKVALRSSLFVILPRKHIGFKVAERIGFLAGLARWR